MSTPTTLTEMIHNPNGMEDYDPNAMPVIKAKAFIRQFLNPVKETEIIPLTKALGRVIAKDILSPANVPNYDNSAMDGYAFGAENLFNTPLQTLSLKIIGTVFAGKSFDGPVNVGECVRIMTGGMMPLGTDTVVVQEKVLRNDNLITLQELPKPKANVRYAGEDLQHNQVVLAAGHLIKPADIGLIASLGIAEVLVYRQLKVAFFSTGDELVGLNQPLKTGQVYDSNRYTIFAMLNRLGVEALDLGAIPDTVTALESTLLKAASLADVVITSGGVSVGEADFMKQLLVKHGEVLFWKISMKPGRPLAFGNIKTNTTKTAHYFGLPGNPVAVMVTFYQFVREALLILMGQQQPAPIPTLEVICTAPIKKLTGRTEFQRGIFALAEDGTWKVQPTGAQGSAILSSMSRANCFIVLDENTGHLEAGATVKIQLFEGFF